MNVGLHNNNKKDNNRVIIDIDSCIKKLIQGCVAQEISIIFK